MSFKLAGGGKGLYVERLHLRSGTFALQAMRFEDERTFLRWCDADHLNFRYPQLYSDLKRSGCALLSTGQPSPPAA